jgi:hypothetical protein
MTQIGKNQVHQFERLHSLNTQGEDITMINNRSTKAAALSGGVILFALGIAFFGGSYVLEIDGLRASGIGLAVIGIVLMLISARQKRKA